MGKANRLYALLLIIVLAGCATFAVGGQFQAGRRALLVGDPETALGYFSAVAEQDPNYVSSFRIFSREYLDLSRARSVRDKTISGSA